MNENDFTQEELKQLFYHIMNEDEYKKFEELDADTMLKGLITPTYQIKYIENIGYVFIGEGYLIMEGHREVTHYFLYYIFDNIDDAKSEILKEYQEKK